jgi:Bacterial regulatory protein, Fis family
MHGDKRPTQAYGGRTGDAIIGMTRQDRSPRQLVNKLLTMLLCPDEGYGGHCVVEYRAMRTHAPISSSSRRRLARRLVGSSIRIVERDLILETLAHTGGNRTESARLLGVSVRSLRNKISDYSAEGFSIPRHERRGKGEETIVPTNEPPMDEAAAMPVALATMSRVAASDCGS